MSDAINPGGILPPFNNAYSHGVVIPPGARVLVTAGQVGARPDGTTPPGAADQAEQVWLNLEAILAGAGMGVEDIVKVTAYVVGAENYPAYAAARSRHLGNCKPAATAVCVAALVKPEWLIEVEIIAAKS